MRKIGDIHYSRDSLTLRYRSLLWEVWVVGLLLGCRTCSANRREVSPTSMMFLVELSRPRGKSTIVLIHSLEHLLELKPRLQHPFPCYSCSNSPVILPFLNLTPPPLRLRPARPLLVLSWIPGNNHVGRVAWSPLHRRFASWWSGPDAMEQEQGTKQRR